MSLLSYALVEDERSASVFVALVAQPDEGTAVKQVDRDIWVSDGTGRFESSSFVADLKWSARVLRRAPVLVLVTLVLSLPIRTFGGPETIAALPFEIVLAGFIGTQRVWFARLYGGEAMYWRDIWRITRSFIGRFVVPALALTTASVGRASRIGLRLIRQTWPSRGWYVLTPGLTLVALAQAFRPASWGLATAVAVVAVPSALALWFKGAIVAFYLRQNPVSPTS